MGHDDIHAPTHENGGGDEITVAGLDGVLAADQHVIDAEAAAAAATVKLDDFATPDDNTDLDFGTARHGLTPKGTNVGDFLRDDGTWAAVAAATTLAGLMRDMQDNRTLLCLVESSRENGTLTDGPIPLGMEVKVDGSGAIDEANIVGGGVAITTGATPDSQSVIATPGKTASANMNPHFLGRLRSFQNNASLKVQAWGFVLNAIATLWTSTTEQKACFRSVTTGGVFAVTGNAGGEETTDVSAFHTGGNEGVFEIFTTDDGSTWKFHIAGVERASHTTTVPGITTTLRPLVGLETNTTANTNIRVNSVLVYQDRV